MERRCCFDVFYVIAAFSHGLALQATLAADSFGWAWMPHHRYFRQQPPHVRGCAITQAHPGSRECKVALTLRWKGICHLGACSDGT